MTDLYRVERNEPGCPESGGSLVLNFADDDQLRALIAAISPQSCKPRRACTTCTAIVSSYPQGMACHCQETPWPLASPTPTEGDTR